MSPATGPPPWIWLTLAAIFAGVPALIISCAVILRARATRRATRVGGAPAQIAGPVRAQARLVMRCGMAGLGIGVLIGISLVLAEHGGLAPLACAAGYLTGLLWGEFAAQPPARGQQRVATLGVRRPADYSPRWAILLAAVAAALTLAAPVAFRLAPTIRYGRWQPYPTAGFSLPGGTTSWPALSTTAAGAALVLLIALLGVAGLRRVAARPRVTDANAADLDELLRWQAGRAIAGAVLGIELLVLAALLIAGSAGLGVPVPAISKGAYLGNRVMVWSGLGCIAGAVICWLALSGWTRRYRGAQPAGGQPAGPTLRTDTGT